MILLFSFPRSLICPPGLAFYTRKFQFTTLPPSRSSATIFPTLQSHFMGHRACSHRSCWIRRRGQGVDRVVVGAQRASRRFSQPPHPPTSSLSASAERPFAVFKVRFQPSLSLPPIPTPHRHTPIGFSTSCKDFPNSLSHSLSLPVPSQSLGVSCSGEPASLAEAAGGCL